MSDLNSALDTTIAAAVTARVEAEVVAALSGDEVIGQYVAAALQEPVVVKDRSYRDQKVPYLRHVLTQAFQDVAKAAVARVLDEERAAIEDEVRKAVKRESAVIAKGITESLAKQAESGYGVKVELNVRGS